MENRGNKRARRMPARGLYSYAAMTYEEKRHSLGRWIASGTERIIKDIVNRAARRGDKATLRQAPGLKTREQQRQIRKLRLKTARRALRRFRKASMKAAREAWARH